MQSLMSFYEGGRGSHDTNTRGKEGSDVTRSQRREMWPQEAGRDKEQISPWSLRREHGPVNTLILSSRTGRECISVVVSHLFGGDLF